MKTIVEDTRNQVGKHDNVRKQLEALGYKIVRSKMIVGDYTLPTNQTICIDTKKDLNELCSNAAQGHARFTSELALAQSLGIRLIILCEHGEGIEKLSDVNTWYNPRLRVSKCALSGQRLFKILYTMEKKHGTQFLFCDRRSTGARIVGLLEGGG